MFKDTSNIKLHAPGVVYAPWRWALLWGNNLWGGNLLSNKEVINFFQKNQVSYVSGSIGHYLILDKEGKAFSFGENMSGQLGINSTVRQATPVAVQTELRFKKVAAGIAHSLFLSLDDNLYSCGSDSTVHYTLRAIVIPGLLEGEKVIDCCAGHSHSLALTDHGRVFGWGFNGNGQLGLGNKDNNNVPQEITSLKGFITSIASQGDSSFCIDSKGRAYAWGDNSYFQLGLGNSNECLVPTQIESLKDFKIKTIQTGYSHTAVLTEGGKVFTFGNTTKGQCGLAGETGLVPYTTRNRNVAVVKNPTRVSIPDEEIQSMFLGHDYTWFLTAKLNHYGCGNGFSYLVKNNKADQKIINPVTIDGFARIFSEDYYEVKKNARKLFLVHSKEQKNITFFSWLPRDMLLKIAAFTGGKSAIQDPEGSMKIASTFFKGQTSVVKEDKTPENKKVEPQISLIS